MKVFLPGALIALTLLALPSLGHAQASPSVTTATPLTLAPPAHVVAPPALSAELTGRAPLILATPDLTRHGGLSKSVQVSKGTKPNATLSGLTETTQTAEVVRIALVLTLLAFIPAIAICMTPFVRIVVVLSMIRHAFGMPETPPNQVLISLALFLTVFTTAPTLQAVDTQALEPFLNGAVTVKQAVDRGSVPVQAFMLRQVHEQDIKVIYDIAKQPVPPKASDVGLIYLTPAFMLNELRTSFKIGFVIFLPFLLIDIVVSSILLSLGMLMVPPATISLPVKILMFVLIDGWGLVLQGIAGSIK